MSWFNLKKQHSPDDEFTEILKRRIFPGGEVERMTRAATVCDMCGHKLDFKEAVYAYSTIKGRFELAGILFDGVTKKGITAEELIEVALKASQGKLTSVEAIALVSYCIFGRVESALTSLNTLQAALRVAFGSDEQGYDADVIPFGVGEFGLEPTNPIPVRGTTGTSIYLGRLRLAGGEPITANRLRALKVVDGNGVVDEYKLRDAHHSVV
jgi:hypothetical protein